MFAVTPIGFVNFRLELWLDYSTQVSINSIWEHSDPIMNTCLFWFLCLWLCVCAVQFLKGLLVLFKDVAILFDHLQLIMEVSIKAPVSDISPGSPSHAVAFCVFNQFQGCPAETYLTLQSKWTHFNKDLYKKEANLMRIGDMVLLFLTIKMNPLMQ